MKVAIGITYILLHLLGLNAFIIPIELLKAKENNYLRTPLIITKGTDSRIGWGFRLRDRFFFQVMVELGPQTKTQPLANQGGDNTNKRNVINNLANTLYAQRQDEKKGQQQKEKERSNFKAGEWLRNWRKTASSKAENNVATSLIKAEPKIAIREIDAKSVIPNDSILDQMEMIKTNKPKKQASERSHNKATNHNRSLISMLTEGDKPAEKEKPLVDVSLH